MAVLIASRQVAIVPPQSHIATPAQELSEWTPGWTYPGHILPTHPGHSRVAGTLPTHSGHSRMAGTLPTNPGYSQFTGNVPTHPGHSRRSGRYPTYPGDSRVIRQASPSPPTQGTLG